MKTVWFAGEADDNGSTSRTAIVIIFKSPMFPLVEAKDDYRRQLLVSDEYDDDV